jgi:hypothetical protein
MGGSTFDIFFVSLNMSICSGPFTNSSEVLHEAARLRVGGVTL